MKIIQQGSIEIAGMHIFKQSDNIVLLEIETVAKHAFMWYSTGQTKDMRGIFLHYDIDEETLHYNREEGLVTEVYLEEFQDWDVWSCNHSRYTTRLTLYKE
jgi:hypothetical protein